jgi:glycosyltransferase involved in cell wall biosynthesis
MRILVVSNNHFGGAGIAAYRLHKALLEAGQDSKMMVAQRRTDDPTVLPVSKREERRFYWRTQFEHMLKMTQRAVDKEERSLALFGSDWVHRINKSDADVVNLHSVNRGMLSIKNIVQITKPLVWTLHDMWAFCGAEHYASDDQDARWRRGYTRRNRIDGDTGLDLDRQTWNRKRKCWKRAIPLITPSRWLAKCVGDSCLMQDWPVEVIPNPLDRTIFRPQDKATARQQFNLPLDAPVLLFGSLGTDPSGRKGFDLLIQSLRIISERRTDIHLAVFGQPKPEQSPDFPFPVHWLGRIDDESKLASLYSAADVMVVPSRMDNAPQTATEAVACGCPVVGFRVGGLAEIVEHGRTGFLAENLDPHTLTVGISNLLRPEADRQESGFLATAKAQSLWTASKVGQQYADHFKSSLI